jgi:hypothetical protein
MEDHDPKKLLLDALQQFDIDVTSHEEKIVYVNMGYAIEIEGKNLFKLSQANQVIAPFDDVADLCDFIKMDMQFNEES